MGKRAATSILLCVVAGAGCQPALVARVPGTMSGNRTGADGRCKPQNLSLTEFAGLEAPRSAKGVLSLAGGALPGLPDEGWELTTPARFVHYTFRADASAHGEGPAGFRAWISGRSAGKWEQEKLIPIHPDLGNDAVNNMFVNGQLHGFATFPAPVDAVRIRFENAPPGFLKGVEVAGQKLPAPASLQLDDGGYLPPGYTRKPIGFSFVSRREWGAKDVEESKFDHTEAKWIIAHHSSEPVSSPDECAAHALSYQRSHMATNGWTDIGYHFLICPDGRVFEGRAAGKGIQGAHALYGNVNTAGISFIGNYQSGTSNPTQTPTEKMLDSGARLVAWLSVEYGIDLSDGSQAPPEMRSGSRMERLSWHNKVGELNATKRYATDCAGDRLISKLDAMRSKAMEYAREYPAAQPPPQQPAVAGPTAPERSPQNSTQYRSSTVASSGDNPCPQH